MTNGGIKNLSVEKLLEELDYCGCDTYYLDYRNVVVAEIKNRLNENEQLKQENKQLKQQKKTMKECYFNSCLGCSIKNCEVKK